MKTAYLLIGVPCSGKSTWAEEQRPMPVFSSDYFIEVQAKKMRTTYDQVFSQTVKGARIKMMAAIELFITKVGNDFIWDQTNINARSRRDKIKYLKEKGYRVVGVSFNVPDPKLLHARNTARIGKSIPEDVIETFIRSFEEPLLSEGFDEIIMYED